MTGYAYETDADKPIAAGEAANITPASGRDPDQPNESQALIGAGLGALSLGNSGLAIWRQE